MGSPTARVEVEEREAGKVGGEVKGGAWAEESGAGKGMGVAAAMEAVMGARAARGEGGEEEALGEC